MDPIRNFRPPEIELPEPSSSKTYGGGKGFTSALKDAIGEVEHLQAEADQQVTSLLAGDGQDVHGAMIAVERADLSFQLMMQVRNKIVNAYQEIARMQF